MIVIPMAGLSSRFFNAGYTKPKYQLMIGDKSVFSWSLKTFEKYFKTDQFVFIYRDVNDTQDFLKYEIDKLGIENYQLVCLDEETRGQADTVYQGIKDLDEESLLIFNIDSKISNFEKPRFLFECDGYLDVFKGQGENWSFIEIDQKGEKVIRTAEKERISDLCSNGLYYFKTKSIFIEAFQNSLKNKLTVKDEFYIAPLYNYLINKGKKICYRITSIDNIHFSGTPDEYELVIESLNKD